MTLAPPVADLIIWPRLANLLTCLCQAIADRNLPEPCMCAVMPGQVVAHDYCNPCSGSQCGMAWVRLDSAFPSTIFPTQDAVSQTCNAPLAFSVEMGIARCCPVGDEDGNPPPPELMEAAAQLQMSDLLCMREAAKCCFTTERTMLGAYQPFGPEGGCVGGTWTVAISTV